MAAVFGVADLCEGLRRAGMRGLRQGGKDLGDLAELMPNSYPGLLIFIDSFLGRSFAVASVSDRCHGGFGPVGAVVAQPPP